MFSPFPIHHGSGSTVLRIYWAATPAIWTLLQQIQASVLRSTGHQFNWVKHRADWASQEIRHWKKFKYVFICTEQNHSRASLRRTCNLWKWESKLIIWDGWLLDGFVATFDHMLTFEGKLQSIKLSSGHQPSVLGFHRGHFLAFSPLNPYIHFLPPLGRVKPLPQALELKYLLILFRSDGDLECAVKMQALC